MSAKMFFEKPAYMNMWFDQKLFAVSLLLLCIGAVVVSSASLAFAEKELGDAMYFLKRHFAHIAIGLIAAASACLIPPQRIQAHAGWLMALAIALLLVVLLPQIGKTVNGSRRWIDFGIFTLQVSELVKLFVVIYLADYIARRRNTIVRSVKEFLMPLLVAVVLISLLLLEPDYGAAFVIMMVILAMLFLVRIKFRYFFLFSSMMGGLMVLALVASPYRWARLIAFSDPWQDPFGHGYQLTQSLIAVGSGGWFGLGLGDSIQKLFYLPEAHTDFIFSIIAEESGFAGVFVIVVLFWLLIQRCFAIGRCADRKGMIAEAHFAYGIGVWFGAQALTNMAVAIGLVPTKGITLPLVSYGGSSLIVSLLAIGLVMRIHHETQNTQDRAAPDWQGVSVSGR